MTNKRGKQMPKTPAGIYPYPGRPGERRATKDREGRIPLPCLLEWNHLGRELGVRWKEDGGFGFVRGSAALGNGRKMRAEDALPDEAACENYRVEDWQMFVDDDTGEHLLRLRVSGMEADARRTYWRIVPECMAEEIIEAS